MIKYFVIPEKRTVHAVLTGTKFDGLRKINKMVGNDSSFCAYHKKYLMPNTFRSKAVCDERDEWNEETGKKIAKGKLLNSYYRSLDKRVDMFRADLIEVNGRVFETSEEVKNNS